MFIRTLSLCVAIACACAACSHNTGVTPSSSTSTTNPDATYGLAGQVVQTGTGNGIASATVTLVDSSGNVTTTATNPAGAFAFGATLLAGTYSLQTVATGYTTSVSSIVIPAT
ncbi:MAG TPA: carboxypeptidase regulatory-like domain-containing protein, partial [Vicinamibacterales bacterium]|nr:carboxypeptidase regulatory-like domain-containing protein [Vicinamibacterales bacterium]